MAKAQDPRWWQARRAQNTKPATYRCPLCGEYLPALSEHMLIMPEGDAGRRRHAHSRCVLAARRAGRLPTREEWQRAQTDSVRGTDAGRRSDAAPSVGRWARLRERLEGRLR
ncbi:MAG: hypothetical protein ACLP50_21145 [Solirubrobacteraceae bacterium]